MTERLYYADSYLRTFDAHVVERLEWDGKPAVVLDRSAFYPSGGGQPHDTGPLWPTGSGDGVRVLDVVERPSDQAVVHVLAGPLDGEGVEGRVDWQRRFDMMQQHTGQHILSAAFVDRLEANTVGFYLSGEYSTIDLDRAPLSADDLVEVEELANSIVFGNRPVSARFVADRDVSHLQLRKPLAHGGPVRIVEIPGFDCSACGGTHVRAAGEVGLIKVTRSERRGTETRVEFLCGGRALADYRTKNALVMDLAREFTVGHRELADMVHRLAEDLKGTRHELRRTRDALLDAEATALWHQARSLGHLRVVQAHLYGRSPDDIKHLAQRLVDHPQTLALLAASGKEGGKGYLTFARSTDLEVHMGSLVRRASEIIGGRGGGRPEFAQGGGPHGERVAEALDEAFQFLVDSIRMERDKA